MDKLIIFNLILIGIIVGILILLKKHVKTEKGKHIVLLVVALSTIACHYSSLLYHQLCATSSFNTAFDYLKDNPNLVLPIYPCNVVMWSCLIYGLLKNKQSKLGAFLTDYIFWFGLISCLVGMFANVDFIRDPRLTDYDVTKGIVAHAIMLLNVLLLPVFGFVKVRLEKNQLHILYSIILMLVIGLYCNLLIETIASKEFAYHVNSMFLIHSPFDGIPFLKYPLISLVAFVSYFVIFAICEMFCYKKEERWYNRLFKKVK